MILLGVRAAVAVPLDESEAERERGEAPTAGCPVEGPPDLADTV